MLVEMLATEIMGKRKNTSEKRYKLSGQIAYNPTTDTLRAVFLRDFMMGEENKALAGYCWNVFKKCVVRNIVAALIEIIVFFAGRNTGTIRNNSYLTWKGLDEHFVLGYDSKIAPLN